jgi:galactoside O-acetyltransferase
VKAFIKSNLKILLSSLGLFKKQINPKLKNTLGELIHIPEGCTILAPENITFGANVGIGTYSFFTAAGGRISIGNNTGFNRNVHINAAVCGEIAIGNDCLIGPNVVMRTADHRFDDITKPIRSQGHICNNIHIEDDVWIGANAVIVGGVSIGKGAVIGAGSVVTKDIPPFAVAVGVPARVIKYRGNN